MIALAGAIGIYLLVGVVVSALLSVRMDPKIRIADDGPGVLALALFWLPFLILLGFALVFIGPQLLVHYLRDRKKSNSPYVQGRGDRE